MSGKELAALIIALLCFALCFHDCMHAPRQPDPPEQCRDELVNPSQHCKPGAHIHFAGQQAYCRCEPDDKPPPK